MRSRVWSRRRRLSLPAGTVPLLLAVAAIALSLAWFDRTPVEISGHAQAIDGDTLRVGRQRVRLVRLDAPELDQTCVGTDGAQWACGTAARSFLAGLLKRDEARCLRSGWDAYGRSLATCGLDGEDVGAQIVTAGWAVADFGYAAEEAAARAARVGIWSGSFIAPAEWRRAHGAAPGIPEWIRSWFQ
jgi:endonuclease YncB( thermonuclease family)